MSNLMDVSPSVHFCRHFRHLCATVIRLQSWRRMAVARRAFLKQRHAATVIQAGLRGYWERASTKRLLSSIRKVQACCRGWLCRRELERRKRVRALAAASDNRIKPHKCIQVCTPVTESCGSFCRSTTSGALRSSALFKCRQGITQSGASVGLNITAAV